MKIVPKTVLGCFSGAILIVARDVMLTSDLSEKERTDTIGQECQDSISDQDEHEYLTELKEKILIRIAL